MNVLAALAVLQVVLVGDYRNRPWHGVCMRMRIGLNAQARDRAAGDSSSDLGIRCRIWTGRSSWLRYR